MSNSTRRKHPFHPSVARAPQTVRFIRPRHATSVPRAVLTASPRRPCHRTGDTALTESRSLCRPRAAAAVTAAAPGNTSAPPACRMHPTPSWPRPLLFALRSALPRRARPLSPGLGDMLQSALSAGDRGLLTFGTWWSWLELLAILL